MPDGKWAELLMKLIDVSPYLAVMIVMAIIIYLINKVAINSHQKIVDKAIEENRDLLAEAVREIRISYETRK